VDGRYIEIGKIKTFFIEQGEGDPIVFIHGAGFAVDGELTWWRQLKAFASGYRVIAFDQVGFGLTDLPPDGIYKGREERVAHVAAFLRARGIAGATLVGHSEGGYIALRIAQQFPDLAGRLVIVNSGSASPMLGGGRDDAWLAAADEVYNYDLDTLTIEEFIERRRRESFVLDDVTERLYRRNFERSHARGHRALARTFSHAEKDMRAYMALQSQFIDGKLSGLPQPILLMWSADDPTVPVERGLALQRLMPRSDMHVFSRAQHMLMHDRSEAFNSVLRAWLLQ
jgi:pimeloyl-ACP methyl ester carboxylesterase